MPPYHLSIASPKRPLRRVRRVDAAAIVPPVTVPALEWEKKLMGSILKALALIAGLAVAQNATAATLVNGGFEEPVQGPPLFAAFNIPAGSTLITGWNVVQGNVDLTNTCCYGPLLNTTNPSSTQAIDLVGDIQGSGGVFGGLSQTFAAVPNQVYRLTFAYSHNNGTRSSNGYAARATIADANAPANTVLSEEVDQAFNELGWQIFSQDFIANSTSMILTFINTRGGFNAGIYLDDVSVELVSQVPLPAALPLFATILGGGGLIVFARRRRQQTV